MVGFLAKIKGSWKKYVTFGCLFIAIFEVLYFLSIYDWKPKSAPVQSQQKTVFDLNLSEDLRQRIGSTSVSNMSYEEWARSFGLTNANGKLDDDPDSEGLPNYLEYVHGTNPLKADSDTDGYSDRQEITNGYDPGAPGDARPEMTISLLKVGVQVPMIWSKNEDEKSLDKDLESGVIHFPKTASPGQNGTAVISGHSSNYVWAVGNYNHIFKDLNNLAIGDVIDVKTVQQNGKIIIYHFKVNKKDIVGPDDQSVFEQTVNPTIALATCWPIGTNLKRLIVRGDLIK